MTAGVRGEGRWARLADRRAAELLTAAAGRDALLVGAPAAFPCAVRGGRVVGPDAADVIAALPLPVASASCATVVDASRPEEPDDQALRVLELARVCRRGGTIALIACAPAPAPPLAGRQASRSLPLVLALLAEAGCDPVRLVPFDLLAPFSPWRLGLRTRAEGVLATLEEHLRFPLVRDAVRLLERHVVAALSPEHAGRVLVVARRRDGAARPECAAPSLAESLAAPGFRHAALRLVQDDAVLRWLAFVDAEILSPAGTRVELVRWLAALGAAPAGCIHPGRWRWPGHEVQRLLEAASHAMAARTIAALGDDAGGAEERMLAATLEYDLVVAFNRTFDRCLEATA